MTSVSEVFACAEGLKKDLYVVRADFGLCHPTIINHAQPRNGCVQHEEGR